jgi:hypothetical protein
MKCHDEDKKIMMSKCSHLMTSLFFMYCFYSLFVFKDRPRRLFVRW